MPSRHISEFRRDRRSSQGLAAVALTLSVVPAAWGHKLNLFTYVEGDTVHVEGYFADGAKAKLSNVVVLNSTEQVIAEGKTNENGEYRFQIPAPADVQIVLDAGLGHQAQYLLAANEFGSQTSSTAAASRDTTDAAPGPMPPTDENATSSAVSAPEISNAQLQALIQRAVMDGIKPLAREIDALKNKTTLQDIVSGFGYILGAFGIWAYLNARRQKRADA